MTSSDYRDRVLRIFVKRIVSRIIPKTIVLFRCGRGRGEFREGMKIQRDLVETNEKLLS